MTDEFGDSMATSKASKASKSDAAPKQPIKCSEWRMPTYKEMPLGRVGLWVVELGVDRSLMGLAGGLRSWACQLARKCRLLKAI